MPTLHRSLPPKATRILLVDADLPARERCASLLQQAGYRVEAASDAASGWVTIRENGYDLLVIDYSLPGGSGLRLIARVRTAHLTIPVILIAGTLPPEDLAGTARLALAATLNRPFTAEQLLETATAALQSTRRAPTHEAWLPALVCCAAD